jgi:leucyl/phenylalanyl-tRNA--protein transferase
LDCQVLTEHLVSLGAREVPRAEFLSRLAAALDAPTLRGRWRIDAPPRAPAP